MTLKRSRIRHGRAFGLAVLLTGAAAAGQENSPAGSEVGAREPVDFHIASLPMGQALNEFASQSHLQLVYETGDLDSAPAAPSITGPYTPQAALDRLLANTNLNYAFVNQKTIQIQSEAALNSDAQSITPLNSGSPLTTLEHGQDASAADPDPSQSENPTQSQNTLPSARLPRSDVRSIDQIVVTGTHLKAVTESPSPVQVFTRDDIERTGVGTVGSFIQQLPQNFNGGASENTISKVAGGGNSGNAVGATGVNLRGLGNDSTMVLVDGHRLAPGNTTGNFADISMIPLTAVERIELVTDGASAIYGSDAVGGVVNFILRRNFEGAETRARFASVNDGSSHETQIGQTVGHNWGSGSGIVSYEFYDRTPLYAADRSYTQQSFQPFTLLPEQARNSVFVTLTQALNSKASLFAEGSFSHRSTWYDASAATFAQNTPSTISSYSETAGARVDLWDSNELEISASQGSSDTDSKVVNLRNGSLATNLQVKTAISSFDAIFRGGLWTTPGGAIKYAIGGQYRIESFDSLDFIASSRFRPRRNLWAEFVEVRVPIMGPGSKTEGKNRLELNVADRQERYSDFGSTNNPQAGLIWNIFPGLKVRGTVGTSFKAPLLSDLNPSIKAAIPYPLVDPVSGTHSCAALGIVISKCTDTLVVYGGNPNLNPEKATTWTYGLDFRPAGFAGFQASATYYSIHYRDRITNPVNSINLLSAFQYESILGPVVLQRDPAAALVQGIYGGPGFQNFFGLPATAIGAIFNAAPTNLAVVNTRGVDISIGYKTDARIWNVDTGIDATRILTFDNQFTNTAPMTSIVDTVYNPLKWKARGRVGLSYQSLAATLFVNYENSYENPGVSPVAPISSWTTFDLTARYECVLCEGELSKLSAILGVQNISNRDPPFVTSMGGFAVNFDGANANALGRYWSLQLVQRW